MNATFFLFLVFLQMVFSVTPQDVITYAQPADEFKLNEKQLDKLRIAALNGSVEAADKLVRYYDFYKHDHMETMRWLTISAENGSHLGCSGLIIYMREDKDPDLQERAKFWAKQDATGKCSSLSD